MKKALIVTAVVVAVTAAGLYVFRAPLMDAAFARLTADMFVATDEDAFDPGVAVGEAFPPIHADYQGRTVTRVEEFAGPGGLVFFAVRSVDW